MIPIPIVWWRKYTSSSVLRRPKQITCAGCNHQYDVVATVELQGTGRSLYMLDDEGAEQRAHDRVKLQAQNSPDEYFSVPDSNCPRCNHFNRARLGVIERERNYNRKADNFLGRLLFWALLGPILLMTMVITAGGLYNIFFRR